MQFNRYLTKRSILWAAIISLVLYAIGFFLVAASVHCYHTPTTLTSMHCGAGGYGGSTAGATIGGLILFLAFLTMMASWLLGLVKTARLRAWVWFVVVFLVPPFGSFFYGLFGPERPPANIPTFIEDTPRTPVV